MSEEEKKTPFILRTTKEGNDLVDNLLSKHTTGLKRKIQEPPEEEFIPDSVRLSNKGCPRYYNNAEMSWRGYCGCPKGHCWYDAQKARRKEGKKALSIDFWEAALEKDKEDEEG